MKILLFKHHDFLSFAIKAITRGQYVHAALLIDEKGLEIAEAFFPYVRRRPLQPEELANADVFYVKDLTPDMQKKAVAWAVQQVANHDTYSIMDLFRFIPEIRAFIGEPSDDAAAHSMFCSMFVFEAVKAAGIELLHAASYDIAPSQLAWSPLLNFAPPLIPKTPEAAQ